MQLESEADVSVVLEKVLVLYFLEETLDRLRSSSRKNEKAASLAYDINQLIGEARYCITDWAAVSNFYQWAACLLGRSLEFLGNGDRQEVQTWVSRLDAAEEAVKPFVLDEFQGTDTRESQLHDLGF